MDAPTENYCQSNENHFLQCTDGIDPRIQVELEKLNRASNEINCLELQLQAGRNAFRQLLTDTTRTLKDLSQKLGKCVDKARPYYEARIKAREIQLQAQTAVLRFERSCSMLAAAKEMVHLAEQGYVNQGQPFDPAWQEMLNHATTKVNEAENERIISEKEHEAWAKAFAESDRLVKKLQKEFKRNINKSRPYFEAKAKGNQLLQEQKAYIEDVERGLAKAKLIYRDTLNELEQISEEIHRNRKLGMQNTKLSQTNFNVHPSSDPSTLIKDLKQSTSCMSDLNNVSYLHSNSQISNGETGLSEKSGTSGNCGMELCTKHDDSLVKDNLSSDTGYLSDNQNGIANTDCHANVPQQEVPAVNKDNEDKSENGIVQLSLVFTKKQLESIPVVSHPLQTSITEEPSNGPTNPEMLPLSHKNQSDVSIDAQAPSQVTDAFPSPASPSSPQLDARAATLSVSSPVVSLPVLVFQSSGVEIADKAAIDDNSCNTQTLETNAAVMASIQKLKGFAKSLLRGKPSSRNSDITSEASCDSAMASVSLVGDEIIDNLAIEPEDYALFLAAASASTAEPFDGGRMDTSYYAN